MRREKGDGSLFCAQAGAGTQRDSARKDSRPLFRRAFSLLEVLLALAIFVGSAALLSRLVLLGIENAEFARLQAHALLLAESRFAELEAGILTVDDAGTYPVEEAPDWQWTLGVENQDTPGLYLVEIVVENISEGTARGYSLRLVRLYYDDSSDDEESE